MMEQQTFTIAFSDNDFETTPIFSEVEEFSFSIVVDVPLASGRFINPPLQSVDYQVRGDLIAGTPSGFPAFNLERRITGEEFYQQGSSLEFEIASTANLEDGLQVSELEVINDSVFVFNGREIDTGRFHPPLLALNADGTGNIQNSNNIPSLEPLQEADFGAEYITDLNFDPNQVTLVDPIASSPPSLTFGSTEADDLAEDFNSSPTIVFTGSGDDQVNGDSLAVNGNRIYGGSDDDQLLVSQNDRAFGGSGNDVILSGEGENRLYGGLGNDDFFVANNDRVFGGNGIDRIFMETGGNNRLTGESGNDQFWFVATETPDELNLITDFTSGEDVIGITGVSNLEFDDLTFTEAGTDVIIGLDANSPIVQLQSIDRDLLNPNDFTFAKEEITADVEAVEVGGTPNNYTFSVTVSSPDTGCEQYADWWEVIKPSGELLDRRILLHSHVNEQPFTRSSSGIEISPTETVIIRGHMNETGYGGQVLKGSVSSGFEPLILPESFASDLESVSPQPSDCAF